MSAIIPPLRFAVKSQLIQHLRLCRDDGLQTLYLAPRPAGGNLGIPNTNVPY
jgi:hypothetical protein